MRLVSRGPNLIAAMQVLVGYLVQHGTNAEVPKVADRLLDRLLTAFPALQVDAGLFVG